MQKFLITGALVMILAASAYAADSMSGPAQAGNTGMTAGMAHSDSTAHDGMAMGKKKIKKPMKHDAMTGGSMSGPVQTGGGTSSGSMSGPNR